MNAFQRHPEFEDGKQFLGLRSSLENHNCSLNAECPVTTRSPAARVRIIVSLRDIVPGEEIYICYNRRLGLDMKPDSLVRRRDPPVDLLRSLVQQGKNPQEFDFYLNESNLKFKWRIICPDHCFCKNPETRKLFMEAKLL